MDQINAPVYKPVGLANQGNCYVALSRRDLRAWGRFARNLGLAFHFDVQDRWVHGDYRGHAMRLYAAISPRGRIVTRLRLLMAPSAPEQVALFRETWRWKLEKLLGRQVDIQLEDVEFGPRYIVFSPDPALPARVIQSITRARLLELRHWKFNWYSTQALAEREGFEHDPERLERVLWILLEVAQELEGRHISNC